MWRVPSDLLQVAERIAQAENRIGKLRLRVARLRDEGSDATQAEELLNSIAGTLGHSMRINQICAEAPGSSPSNHEQVVEDLRSLSREEQDRAAEVLLAFLGGLQDDVRL